MVKRNLAILAITLVMVTGLEIMAQDDFKPSVDFKGSRIAFGYLDSGNDGSYPDGSVMAPDAKLRFNWNMQPNMTVVTRMSIPNGKFDKLDYIYLDYKNLFAEISPSLKDSAFNPLFRIGRIKLDIGEETFADNPVESALISNSAGIVAGYDDGFQLSQTLDKDVLGIPFKWSLSLTSGNASTDPMGVDNEQGKATCLKIGLVPMPNLYVSASYYNSGDLGSADAEVTYAALKTRPTNSTTWTRVINELDVRYDFQPGKENRLNPGAPAFSDSKAFVRLAYGQFTDNGKDKVAPILAVVDREGKYYFLEGYYQASPKIYLAGRYSIVGFDKSTLYASLNSVAANEYKRISIGAGYRMSNNTHLKVESRTDTETVASGTTAPENNQVAIMLVTKF
jgi:hypothetical protein